MPSYNGPLPTEFIDLSAADAENRARGQELQVRVQRPSLVYAAGPFQPHRLNLHVDEDEVVVCVSRG